MKMYLGYRDKWLTPFANPMINGLKSSGGVGGGGARIRVWNQEVVL